MEATEVAIRGLRGLGGLHPIFFSHHPLLFLVALAIVVVVVLVVRSQDR